MDLIAITCGTPQFQSTLVYRRIESENQSEGRNMSPLQPHHEIAWTEKFKRYNTSAIGIRTNLMILVCAALLYFVLGSITNKEGLANLGLSLGLAFIPGEIFRNWQVNREKNKQESELQTD